MRVWPQLCFTVCITVCFRLCFLREPCLLQDALLLELGRERDPPRTSRRFSPPCSGWPAPASVPPLLPPLLTLPLRRWPPRLQKGAERHEPGPALGFVWRLSSPLAHCSSGRGSGVPLLLGDKSGWNRQSQVPLFPGGQSRLRTGWPQRPATRWAGRLEPRMTPRRPSALCLPRQSLLPSRCRKIPEVRSSSRCAS